jgi:hypothetical protein
MKSKVQNFAIWRLDENFELITSEKKRKFLCVLFECHASESIDSSLSHSAQNIQSCLYVCVGGSALNFLFFRGDENFPSAHFVALTQLYIR